MIWYDEKGKADDVVLSSRVRIARNIVDYPFPIRLEKEAAQELIGKISSALGDGFKRINMLDTEPQKAAVLVEKHLISPEFATGGGERALFTSEDEHLSVMACEEDHLRIQAILGGYELEKAFEEAYALEEKLDGVLQFAYDDELGYITHCPTNLGTALRISVMMFLPALTYNHQMPAISEMLQKFGLTIRGVYGEGSKSEGCLYQISNQITLGISERDTLKRLTEALDSIIERERKSRELLKNTQNKDKIMRSLGNVLYCEIMSSDEFEQHYKNLRLGASLGYIDTDVSLLDSLYVKTKSACVGAKCIESGKENTPEMRDMMRAKLIKETLSK